MVESLHVFHTSYNYSITTSVAESKEKVGWRVTEDQKHVEFRARLALDDNSTTIIRIRKVACMFRKSIF